MKTKAHFWIHKKMEKASALPVASTRELALFSSPFAGYHATNEDALAAIETPAKGLVLLLADGAGGMPQGDRASRYVIQTLTRKIAKSDGPIAENIFQCQKAILSWKIKAGTTLIAAEIVNGKIRVYHCGDSELLLLDAKGNVKYKTTSHSPTGYLQAAGALTSRQALKHPDRPYITNYLGAENFFLQISPWLEFKTYDYLVIGSDGLFDNLAVEQIQDLARTASSPLTLATELSNQAKRQMERAHENKTSVGKADDLSLMVLGKKNQSKIRLLQPK